MWISIIFFKKKKKKKKKKEFKSTLSTYLEVIAISNDDLEPLKLFTSS